MKKLLVSLAVLGLLTLYIAGIYLTHSNHTSIGSIPNDVTGGKRVDFLSKSGSRLSGWLLKASDEKGGVLLLHGVRSNRLQMLSRAKFLQKAGYSVLLFDFQAHGESNGNQITFGYLESLDASSAFEYLEGQIPSRNIGVIGVSMGGAAALLGDVKNKAKVLILESVYPSIQEAIEDRMNIYLGSNGHYLSFLLTSQLYLQLGITVDDLRPIEHIKDAQGAVMIIAGSEDRRTTPEESRRMFDMAKDPKILWIVKAAGHINFDKFKGEEYEKRILDFMDEYM